MKEKIKLFALAWTFGIAGGLILLILRIFGRLKLRGNIISAKEPNKGLLLISNHPSLWEAAIFPFLFFPNYLWDASFVPLSTPDKKNFYDKRWFIFFRPICIPISREEGSNEAAALKKIVKSLQEGRIVIIFAEGGRTYRGQEFRKSQIKKKTIRPFQSGVGLIARLSKAPIVPVWTEGGQNIIPNKSCESVKMQPFCPRIWNKMAINAGSPLQIPEKMTSRDITLWLEEKLLDLADSF